MKIREVHFQDIRGFGSTLRTVRFYDVDTSIVRPLSVIVGSNGSGKSTLFQIIEGLLSYALDLVKDRPITHELLEEGYAIEYKKHPKGLINIDPEAELRDWGHRRGAPATLDQEYQRHRAMLSSLPQAEWPAWITGKAVLKVFLDGFPKRSISHELLKSIYIDKHPNPHAELVALVTRIVERRGQP